MSAISKLLAKHCPSGVPMMKLGDLVSYEQPGKYLVSSTAYSDKYPVPVLTAGQTFVLGYTNETKGVYPASKENPVIIFDDFTTAFKWVDFPFKAKSSAMKMLTAAPNSVAGLRYIFFSMQTIGYQPKEHARQWISTFANFEIPVPAPEVQREIVATLDVFLELELELNAELEARRRQYEFYRHEIFGPDGLMKSRIRNA
jgi:type I restriction enzyme, S subunit